MRTPMTVLFIHGAYHGPWVWDATIKALPDLPTHAVACPSSGPELGSLDDDAEAVSQAIERIAGPILVVAHSYGGVVATQALRAPSSVASILYVAAVVPDIGEGTSSPTVGEGLPPIERSLPRTSGGSEFSAEFARAFLYHDVDGETARLATSRLVPTSRRALGAAVTRTAWREIPSSYVVCTEDALLTTAAQQRMARRTQKTHHLAASHSPMLSRPEELARIIAAQAAQTQSGGGRWI